MHKGWTTWSVLEHQGVRAREEEQIAPLHAQQQGEHRWIALAEDGHGDPRGEVLVPQGLLGPCIPLWAGRVGSEAPGQL